MAVDTVVPRSRRVILGAALAAVAASVTAALHRPRPVIAAESDPVVVGGNYSATTDTAFTVSGSTNRALAGISSGSGDGVVGSSSSGHGLRGSSTSGNGVMGFAGAWSSSIPSGVGVAGFADATAVTIGVQGNSTTGSGIQGRSDSGYGVEAISQTGTALRAHSNATYGYAIDADVSSSLGLAIKATGAYGLSAEGTSVAIQGFTQTEESTGIFGSAMSATGETYGVGAQVWSPAGIGMMSWHVGNGTALAAHTGDTDTTVTPQPNTAILGIASQTATSARGVVGRTTAGYGVHGQSTVGRGVYGQATTGQGIRGYATGSTGTAGYFSTPTAGGLHSGTALLADGRVRFPNCAGVTTIAVGQKTAVVTPGIDLTSSSAVVASLMGSAGGTTNVHRVGVNSTADTFTIFLTADNTAAAPVRVAWHVFG